MTPYEKMIEWLVFEGVVLARFQVIAIGIAGILVGAVVGRWSLKRHQDRKTLRFIEHARAARALEDQAREIDTVSRPAPST